MNNGIDNNVTENRASTPTLSPIQKVILISAGVCLVTAGAGAIGAIAAGLIGVVNENPVAIKAALGLGAGAFACVGLFRAITYLERRTFPDQGDTYSAV